MANGFCAGAEIGCIHYETAVFFHYPASLTGSVEIRINYSVNATIHRWRVYLFLGRLNRENGAGCAQKNGARLLQAGSESPVGLILFALAPKTQIMLAFHLTLHIIEAVS